MIKKDLNLFTAYKSGSIKTGNNSSKGLILTIVSFILIVAVSYGGLLFLKANTQDQIASIRNELSDPAKLDAQSKLDAELKKNSLMNTYNTALKLAKESFDASRLIDSDLFNDITSAMPQDFIITDIKITAQSIRLSGACMDDLSPAVFKQALEKKDLFNSIIYNGVSVSEDGSYFFNIDCKFKELNK